MGIGMHMKNKNLRNVWFGFIAWFIPFVVSFLLYSPEGEPLYDVQVTHNILVVIGSGLCAFLFIKYFKAISKDFTKEGIIVGITWLLISSVLDIIFFVFMFNMPFTNWLGRIGIGYLIFPIMSVSMGIILDCKLKK